NATIYTSNETPTASAPGIHSNAPAAGFQNEGAEVAWTMFDRDNNTPFLTVVPGQDYHRMITMVDPTTGRGRIIAGNDQGILTWVDNGNGGAITGIGTAPVATGARNGNLQIPQFYYGAAQPSNIAAQAAQALFYGEAQDNGHPASDPNVLTNGNLNWTGV